MFKGLSNLANLSRQMQEMQGRAGEVQENLRKLRVTGTAGGGMVTVEANGQQQVLSCRIEPQLLQSNDREVLEDLIIAATNAALDKSRELAAQEFSKLTSGFDLSGMRDMLNKFGLGGDST